MPKVPMASADLRSATYRIALLLHRRTSGTALDPIDYNSCILSPPLCNDWLLVERPRLLLPALAALALALGAVPGRAFLPQS